jgi:23S rRNA pseudouridine2605 synthase
MEPKPERLQKVLAAAGLASRRKAEELIAAGLVSVNGEIITEPGSKADPRLDEIRVEGKLLRGPERHVYLALYKPKGHVTTVSDPEGRPTVMDLLKGVDERVFPVGRLDYMSEGLLLLTNDGELMAKLTSAGSKVAKTYMVKVAGKPTEEEIEKLRNGIMLPPEPGLTGARGKKQPGVERRSFAVLTQPAYIQLAVDQENPWFEVTLSEGRNRQIRRMFEQIGHHIEKIKRVRYGSLTLDVEPGEFRHLTAREVNLLRKSPETPFKPKPFTKAKAGKFERTERAPRVDSARFVKGRRGKPAAAAPAAAGAAAEAPAPRRDFPSKPFEASASKGIGPKRSFEKKAFGEKKTFGERKPYVRKPDSTPREAGPAGDASERPRRAFTPREGRPFPPRGDKPFAPRPPRREFTPREGHAGGERTERPAFRPRGPEFKRERPEGSRPFAPRSAEGRERPSYGAKREGGFAPKREGSFAPKREGGFAAKREGGFAPKRKGGFSKFGKPSAPRREGGFESRPPREGSRPRQEGAGERPFTPQRKAPGGFSKFDRSNSRGPGKPAPRGSGGQAEGGERRSFTPREGRPAFGGKPTGGFGKKSGGFGGKPRSSAPDRGTPSGWPRRPRP